MQIKEQLAAKIQKIAASFRLSHFVLAAGSAFFAVKYPPVALLFIAVFYLQSIEKAAKD